MKVSELKQLLSLVELSSTDRGAAVMGIDDKAIYIDGWHSSGEYRLKESLLTSGVGVQTELLQATLQLFDDPDEEVKIAKKGKRLSIKSKTKASTLGITPPPMRPDTKPPKSNEYFTVERAALAASVTVAGAGTSKNIARPLLAGIHIHTRGDKIVMEATDGMGRASLAFFSVEEARDGFETLDATVPEADLRAGLAVIGEVERIEIALTDNRLYMKAGRTRLSFGLLEGDYPDILGKLPKKFENKVTLPLDALTAVSRAAAIFDTNRIVRIRLLPKGRITVRADGQEKGAFEAVVKNRHEVNGEFEIAFDADLLLQAEVLGPEIVLHFKDAKSITLLSSDKGMYWLSPLLTQ